MATTTKIANAASKTGKKALEATKKTADLAIKNPKTTLSILAGLIGIYAVYKIYNAVSDFSFGNDEGAGGGNLDPNSPNYKPPGATITTYEAQTIAAALRQAMVVWHGTDEQKIFDNLQGKKPIDFAMISKAFGTPRYDDMGDAFWPFPQQTLTYWLNNELTSSEMAHLKSIMPGVL